MTTEMTPAMRRSILIATLRDKTLWPEGFQWDFSNCDRCAMGMLLRQQLNINQGWFMAPDGYEALTGTLLELTERQVKDIFSTPTPPDPDRPETYGPGCDARRHRRWVDVTPAMVADRLEAIQSQSRLTERKEEMTTELTPTMRRSILIATLRDNTLWPKGFEWNYTRRETCAIGLMDRLFGIEASDGWYHPSSKLGLSVHQAINLFNGWAGDQPRVTPEMVADRLEEIHRSLAQ